MAGLGVEAVTVRYGQARAVEEVSFGIGPGEVVALLGPSGCGKSSLLRAVAGLEPLAGGRVTWDGADLAALPVHRRGFGLMFQDGQLFPNLDVLANVAYGLRMAGLGRQARAAAGAEWLELVGLAGYGSRDVATLSGGEAQRVALARALAPRPRLLLLDEPLSALDADLRLDLGQAVRQALAVAGAAALWVTHDAAEAAAADRALEMSAGRLSLRGGRAGLPG
ncbi:MAG: ATP-binding cassette domain-containing protein [Bifidobacteriaceae bacterium]|jgi:thiamine transport system ATP-binding protein|nr:ATP-binding cassette domain-containing protein [Bifidobacteriaceae bacterium]